MTDHDIVDSSFTVTPVRDATAAFTREMMQAAQQFNGPTFAHAFLTTAQLIAALLTPKPNRPETDADQRCDLAGGAAR